MLDREAVGNFLDENFTEINLEIPKDITRQDLIECFCQYVEDDYYEWLKDNFQTFFHHGHPDWDLIKEQIFSLSKNES